MASAADAAPGHAPGRTTAHWGRVVEAWRAIVRVLTGEAREGMSGADVRAYYRTTDG